MKAYLNQKQKVESLNMVLDAIKTIEKISSSEIGGFSEQFKKAKTFLGELNYTILALANYMGKKSYPKVYRSKKELLLVVTGNKGLVGSLYTDILNMAENQMHGKDLITIGTKASEINSNKLLSLPMPEGEVFDSGQLRQTVDLIKKYIEAKKISKITAIYPFFEGFISQKAKTEVIFPIDFSLIKNSISKDFKLPTMLISDSDKNMVLKNLLEFYIEAYVGRIFFETRLSEIAARLVNSQKATDKAHDLLRSGIREYLKARRTEITNQQIENFIGHINLS